MNWINKSIRFLNTKKAIFIAVVLAMIPMFMFSVEMFEMAFQSDTNKYVMFVIEVIYAIAVDMSILIHTLRENRAKAYFFAVVSVITVLVVLFNPIAPWTKYVAYVLIGSVLPVAIGMYSHELKKN